MFVSQPSVSFPVMAEQFAKPAAQEAWGTLQPDALHVTPDGLDVRFGNFVQSWPHIPQLAVLLVVFVSQPSVSAAALVQFAKPVAHAD